MVDASPEPDAPVDATPIDAMRPPCTTAGLTCSGEATMAMCGGNCWVRCTASVPYATAKASCAGWMGALGEIDDAAENSCVAAQIGGIDAWLGLIQSNTATTPATGWTWNGIAALGYTHWALGEPEDGGAGERGREQCGYMRPDGTWDDVTCGMALGFLCERL